MVYTNAHYQRGGHNTRPYNFCKWRGILSSAYEMLTTGQSLDFRFIDFKTCTLNYKCGARQPIQNSNTATIQDFDLSSSCLVPRRDGTIVSLLSWIVGCGTKLAGTTGSLASSLYMYAHLITELSISQARRTHLSYCKLLMYMQARFARLLRHISIPLRRNHSSTSVCFLDFPFLLYSARVSLWLMYVVAFREIFYNFQLQNKKIAR